MKLRQANNDSQIANSCNDGVYIIIIVNINRLIIMMITGNSPITHKNSKDISLINQSIKLK